MANIEYKRLRTELSHGELKKSASLLFRRGGMPRTAYQDIPTGTTDLTEALQGPPSRIGPSSIIQATATPTEAVVFRPPTNVSIDMFDSRDPIKAAGLAYEVFGPKMRVLAARAANPEGNMLRASKRRKTYLGHNSGVSEADYTRMRRKQSKREGDRRRRSINNHALDWLRDEFNLPTRAAAQEFFDRHMRSADTVIAEHNAQLYPEGARPEIHPRVAKPQSPGALATAFFSQDTVVRHESQRKALLALISAQIEHRAKGADAKIRELQDLLDRRLFIQAPDNIKLTTVYGRFNNSTNELIELSEERPTEPAPVDQHYKAMPFPLRQMTGSDLKGFLIADEKEPKSSVTKTVFKAIKEKDKGETGEIKLEDMEDTHRLMVVIDGGDTEAEELLYSIGYMVIGNTDSLIDVRFDNETDEENGPSEKVGLKRVKLDYDGLPTIEIQVKTLERKINGDRNNGKYDPETGTWDGIGHRIFKITKRAPAVDQVYNPGHVYTLARPYEQRADGSFHHPVLESVIMENREYAVYEPKAA